MMLRGFRDVLLSVGVPVHHYAAEKQALPYIVWHEFGAKAWHGDNARRAVAYKIQVDLYTAREFDPLSDALEAALREAGVAFAGPVTIYDPIEKEIRLIYECEWCSGGAGTNG